MKGQGTRSMKNLKTGPRMNTTEKKARENLKGSVENHITLIRQFLQQRAREKPVLWFNIQILQGKEP